MRRLLGAIIFLCVGKVSASPYCAAIRGNGENIAAHWASLARIVETDGLPRKMAGGSSAVITMFLLDQIAKNPVLREGTQTVRAQRAALLIKTLPVFLATMTQREGILDAFEFALQLSDLNSPLNHRVIQGLENLETSPQALRQSLGKYLPLVNGELIESLQQQPQFFAVEAQNSLKAIGDFNATEDNIFFRPGWVDYKFLALVVGAIGDFYAGLTDEQMDLADWTKECAPLTQGQFQLPQECQEKFAALVVHYLNYEYSKLEPHSVFAPIGQAIPSIPTTALIESDGLKRYQDLKAKYLQGQPNSEYASFSLRFEQDLAFGYWIDSRDFQRKLRAVAPEDLKVAKFKSLGAGNWFEALSVSPAEPSQANFQKIPFKTKRSAVLAGVQSHPKWSGLNYREDMLSAGGWSDLHPVNVLKASNCERVIYFSRRGGDTVFGQQAFIRLVGLTEEIPFWLEISEQNREGWKVSGTTAENTPWNTLYNYGNPNSSYNQALRLTDAVYCTNWDDFEPFKTGQLEKMLADSYSSTLIENPRLHEVGLNPGCVPK